MRSIQNYMQNIRSNRWVCSKNWNGWRNLCEICTRHNVFFSCIAHIPSDKQNRRSEDREGREREQKKARKKNTKSWTLCCFLLLFQSSPNIGWPIESDNGKAVGGDFGDDALHRCNRDMLGQHRHNRTTWFRVYLCGIVLMNKQTVARTTVSTSFSFYQLNEAVDHCNCSLAKYCVISAHICRKEFRTYD